MRRQGYEQIKDIVKTIRNNPGITQSKVSRYTSINGIVLKKIITELLNEKIIERRSYYNLFITEKGIDLMDYDTEFPTIPNPTCEYW